MSSYFAFFLKLMVFTMNAQLSTIIDIARAFTVSLMLSYAAYQDIKVRRVTNKVWMVFAPIAIVLLTAEIVFSNIERYAIMLMLINIVMGFIVAFAAFYLGILGGADAKAIMILSVLVPRWPVYTMNPLEVMPPILDALITSAVIALIYFPIIFVYNLLRGDTEFPLSLLGIKMCKDQAVKKKTYYIPLYKLSKDTGKLELRIRLTLPPEDELEDIWRAIESSDMDEIWVSPGIPFMVYLFIGTVIIMVFGDVFLRFLLGFLR